MKLLVIGGSYFLGRVFVMEAHKEHNISLLNRGTYDMSPFGVRQITGDRRDGFLWESVEGDFDAIIDFCAYEAGDIANVLEHFKGHIGQYILISTVDVYARGTGKVCDETAALERRELPGDAGSYIRGKVALEEELCRCCPALGIPYTILRPAILYGPYNYAPRESVFIELMVRQHVLFRLTDAAGRFCFAYVKDTADAILKCLQNEKAYGEAFNIVGDEIADYNLFSDCLEQAGAELMTDTSFDIIRLSVKEAPQQGLMLPFPVTAKETELYSNQKSKDILHMEYIGLAEGMRRTFRAFYHVYK